MFFFINLLNQDTLFFKNLRIVLLLKIFKVYISFVFYTFEKEFLTDFDSSIFLRFSLLAIYYI